MPYLRSWDLVVGDWYDVDDWTTNPAYPNNYPLPGDTALILDGRVEIAGSEAKQDGVYDGVAVEIGSDNQDDPAVLQVTSAVFGHFFSVTADDNSYSLIDTIGASGFAGPIDVDGALTISAETADDAEAADFVLRSGGSLTIASGGSLTLQGAMKVEANFVASDGGTFVNDGVLSVYGTGISFDKTATLTGTGTIEVAADSTVHFYGDTPSSQTIAFDADDSRISITQPDAFDSPITNFRFGDVIDLVDILANYANFDASTGVLTVKDGGDDGVTVASLDVSGPPTGLLTTVSDGSSGTYIEYADTPPRLKSEIADGDLAMGSNVVRSTMTTPAGASINGTGVKVGVISDSFDEIGGAAAAAADGYLPYDAATGQAAVTVLKDGTSASDTDEGQAMAELIHQVSPDAQLYFYAGDSNNMEAFAAGINALVAAGCNIIVDDQGVTGEPFFQVAGPVDTAIQNAIASGVNYFTSAGNLGDAYYQSNFNPVQTTLYGMSTSVSAQQFSNGTPYQEITLSPGLTTTIQLQWATAYPAAGAGVPDDIVMRLYDMSGNLVATSTQVTGAPYYSGVPEVDLKVTPSGSTPTDYQLAIYETSGATVGEFKYILHGASTSGSTAGGYIDDPDADIGSGDVKGHGLVPGVNTVGAATWSNSPTFGTNDFVEDFSNSGSGQLLFNQSGEPEDVSDGKVDFVAPDGIPTTVFNTFYGTSAAAPDAAAVAALMLQANPDLSPAQVTTLMEDSAANMGLPSNQQGAGFVQAPGAVQDALNLAKPGLAIGEVDGDDIVNASKIVSPLAVTGTSDALGQTVTIALDSAANVLGSAVVQADGTWSTTIAPGDLAEGIHRVLASVPGTGGSSATAVASFVVNTALPILAFDAPASFSSGVAVTLSGQAAGLNPVQSVELYEGSDTPFLPHSEIGVATVSADGAWTLSTTLAAGTYNQIFATATDVYGNQSNVYAPFTLQTGVTGEPYTSVEKDYDPEGQLTDKIYSGVSGEPYSSFEYVYAAGILSEEIYDYTDVVGEPFTSYKYDFSPGGAFIGSSFLYPGGAGRDYSTEEVDYDGAGRLTRAAFSGLSGTAYSSYEYDYVGGVITGSKFLFEAAPGEAAYSSYELDFSADNAFSAEKLYLTDVHGQSYTGEEEDVDANGKLSRVVLTGVTGQTYDQLEEDYDDGVYAGYKAYYLVSGQSYTNEEVDVSASGAIEKVAYSGMKGNPYSSVEEEYSGGSVATVTYDYTDVTGQSYSAYQVMEDANGNALMETFDLNSGGHTLIALASGQTLTSLGLDKMTGLGATTFTLNAIYGANTITNFNSADGLLLPAVEYAELNSAIQNGDYSGGNAKLTFSDGDTLTFKAMSQASLTALLPHIASQA